MHAIKHISFDLDGTLVDSFENMRIAWEGAMQELGASCTFLEFRKYVGLPFPVILEHLKLSQLEKELTEIYFSKTRELAPQIKLYPGSHEIIEWAKSIGLSTSIITSKPRHNSELICDRLGLNVDLIICGDDFDHGKPHPSTATPILNKLNLLPSEVVYVGDMLIDFQFSLNVGMPFILVNNKDTAKFPSNLVNKISSIHSLIEIRALINLE